MQRPEGNKGGCEGIEAHYRKKIGVAATSKRLKDVAKMAIDRMQKALDAGEGTKTYVD